MVTLQMDNRLVVARGCVIPFESKSYLKFLRGLKVVFYSKLIFWFSKCLRKSLFASHYFDTGDTQLLL